MGDNVISAILNIFSFRNNNLKNYASKSLIRVNAVGEQLEFYVKDALSNSFSLSTQQKPANYSKVFAWLGNQNHPPDAIIKNGDAFEIKKIEGDSSHLALNSSHPKDVLHNDDERITADCKKCDGGNWKEKDLFYIVGQAKAGVLGYLFLVQGTCYCAKRDVYEKIHEPLKKEITKVLEAKGLEQGDTVELGKVRKADPLGITELRIRGMWQIQNPTKVFSDLCSIDKQKKFNLITIMRKDKYDTYPQSDIKKLEGTKGISVKNIKIREPNNPAKLIDAKLISFSL
jgi:hypothetical protein